MRLVLALLALLSFAGFGYSQGCVGAVGNGCTGGKPMKVIVVRSGCSGCVGSQPVAPSPAGGCTGGVAVVVAHQGLFARMHARKAERHQARADARTRYSIMMVAPTTPEPIPSPQKLPTPLVPKK